MAIKSTGLLAAGLKSNFFERFTALDALAMYRAVSTRVTSDKDRESYRWLGAPPPMREWGTGRKARDVIVEAWNVANQKYECTMEVDRDEISDDQTGQIRIRAMEVGEQAATHKDYLISQLLLNGGTGTGFDGVAFFSTAHVSGASGSQSNSLSAAAATPASPTSAEFKKSFNDAISKMASLKNDQGQPANIGTSGLVAIVPPNSWAAAREALEAAVLNNTSNVLIGAARIMLSAWLPDNHTSWYLCKTDASMGPFIFQDREPIEFKSLEEGSDEEFLREKYLFGARARYAMAYGRWQHCMRTTFA